MEKELRQRLKPLSDTTESQQTASHTQQENSTDDNMEASVGQSSDVEMLHSSQHPDASETNPNNN